MTSDELLKRLSFTEDDFIDCADVLDKHGFHCEARMIRWSDARIRELEEAERRWRTGYGTAVRWIKDKDNLLDECEKALAYAVNTRQWHNPIVKDTLAMIRAAQPAQVIEQGD